MGMPKVTRLSHTHGPIIVVVTVVYRNDARLSRLNEERGYIQVR